jgi:hypothetical protein
MSRRRRAPKAIRLTGIAASPTRANPKARELDVMAATTANTAMAPIEEAHEPEVRRRHLCNLAITLLRHVPDSRLDERHCSSANGEEHTDEGHGTEPRPRFLGGNSCRQNYPECHPPGDQGHSSAHFAN